MPRTPYLPLPVVVMLIALAACRGSVPAPLTPAATSPRYLEANGVVRATVDTIAARLARLELDRAALLARFTPQSAEVATLDRQLQVLREQLGEQPDAAAAGLYADGVIVRAIEERLAGLTVERRLMLTNVRPEHDSIRELTRTVDELERRLAELHRPGSTRAGR